MIRLPVIVQVPNVGVALHQLREGRNNGREEGVSDQVCCNEVGLLDQVKLRALTGLLRSIYSTVEPV